MKKWAAIVLLSIAEFVMVLDTTVMNVSISAVVVDLQASIDSMQMAITMYTLVMASFVLLGGKLGSIWGCKKALLVGSVVYALGALITGLSPTIAVLIIGWSLVEGLGASLVIPAITALAATNYHGNDRVIAYSTIGAVAASAAAAGPLIGGAITTYLSWRFVFIGEVAIMALVLLFSRVIVGEDVRVREKIDAVSVLLSAAGLIVLVYAILQGKVWGWVIPNDDSIALLGISPVIYMIIVGIVLLKFFYDRQCMLEDTGRNPLLKVSMFSIGQLRSGLSVLMAKHIVMGGIFFVIPIYLQMTLGYDALSTGCATLPLSASQIVFSIVGARLTERLPARYIVRSGQAFLIAGALMLIASISVTLQSMYFALGLMLVGGGVGVLASQLNNNNMSAVPERDSAEVGGLQGVIGSLGSSLGTALIGSLLMVTLTTTFMGNVAASNLPQGVKDYIDRNSSSISIVSADDVAHYAESKGLEGDTITNIVSAYTQSQVDALKKSLVIVALLGIFSLMTSRNIPYRVSCCTEDDEETADGEAARSGPLPRLSGK